MPTYDPNSRYAKHAQMIDAQDQDGRPIKLMGVARRPEQLELGEHLLREGQRLDHLANYYLRDPTAFWRLCELNDVLLPDALAEVERVKIPTP